MDFNFEAYKLALAWIEYQDRLEKGQRVAVNRNTLEVNQYGDMECPIPGYEFQPKTLKEFLAVALESLKVRFNLQIADLEATLQGARERIALRNRQIRDLRRAIRK